MEAAKNPLVIIPTLLLIISGFMLLKDSSYFNGKQCHKNTALCEKGDIIYTKDTRGVCDFDKQMVTVRSPIVACVYIGTERDVRK